MRALRQTGVSIRRVLSSWLFWACSLLLTALMFFYSVVDLHIYDNSGLYYLVNFGYGNGADQFMPIICALPAAGLFAEEWCSGNFLSRYIRCGKRGYAAAQTTCAFVTALIMVMLSFAVYCGILLALGVPVVRDPGSRSFIQAARLMPNGDLLVNGHYFIFFFLYALIEGCYAGILSVMGFVFSLIVTNRYIAATIPALLLDVISRILILCKVPFLGIPSNIYSLMSLYPYFHGNARKNLSAASLLYPYVYALALTAALGVAAHFLIKRKVAKSSDMR